MRDPTRKRCVACRTRYRQHHGALCRQCWTAAGCPRPVQATPLTRVERVSRLPRRVSYEGLDGWVVWDGTCPGSIHEAVR